MKSLIDLLTSISLILFYFQYERGEYEDGQFLNVLLFSIAAIMCSFQIVYRWKHRRTLTPIWPQIGELAAITILIGLIVSEVILNVYSVVILSLLSILFVTFLYRLLSSGRK